MTSTEQLPRLSHLYPLRFEPIYQYRVWGAAGSSDLFHTSTPNEVVGEAWLLTDRDDQVSVVTEGPLRGLTIHDLLEQSPEELLGTQVGTFARFPLLLKFLRAHSMLSIQVHPSDQQREYLPVGESGKSEAWVILEADEQSRIYVGTKPGTTPAVLEQTAGTSSILEHLNSFTPKVGDCIFIPAGTIHSLGGGIVALEVQQNSDVTFRLYDWERTDPGTGQPRNLQVAQALACIDFNSKTSGPVTPVEELIQPFSRERLVYCEHFGIWRLGGVSPFLIGEPGKARVIMVVEGEGELTFTNRTYFVRKGDVLLLPAVLGICLLHPIGATTVLEISLSEPY